ncbi:hypothetical protein LTR97_007769 [Elasticomyces elasticus]|uniref:Uncharacterized protein n=1 Tax=Elasticomyces elasticus TaxID=574655 RepID=A0AAN7WCW1_9PEZI|nr:hypothetical protein LTR97_007769 [Elasticomyces elasticus]
MGRSGDLGYGKSGPWLVDKDSDAEASQLLGLSGACAIGGGVTDLQDERDFSQKHTENLDSAHSRDNKLDRTAMAHDLTTHQLLRHENDRLLRAQQNLTTVNEGLLSEQHALRTETHALRVANEAQKTQIDALRKGRDALMVKIQALEDRSVSPNAPGEYHGVDPSIKRIRETLKRKFGYFEKGDDSQAPRTEDERTGTASIEEMATRPIESFRKTFAADSISIGGSEHNNFNGTQRLGSGGRSSSVRVLAFDEQGKAYILNKADEPMGLRNLITTTEDSATELFERHRIGKINTDSSWEDRAKVATGCVRQWCRDDSTYFALQDPQHAACLRCFNARLPCLRYEMNEPSPGFYAVPLPAAARIGVGRDQLAYYICEGVEKNTALEKRVGNVWMRRRTREKMSRSKNLRGSAGSEDNATPE